MTPEAQRIAIAGVCGWPIKTVRGQPAIPDYLNDYNAIYTAEKWFNELEQERFKRWLHVATKSPSWGHRNAIFATAAQRAEAFLRTVGKWVE